MRFILRTGDKAIFDSTYIVFDLPQRWCEFIVESHERLIQFNKDASNQKIQGSSGMTIGSFPGRKSYGGNLKHTIKELNDSDFRKLACEGYAIMSSEKYTTASSDPWQGVSISVIPGFIVFTTEDTKTSEKYVSERIPISVLQPKDCM